MTTPELIIKNLLYNISYAKRVIPFTKIEYFDSEEEQRIVKILKKIFKKYSFIPSITIIKAVFNDQVTGITDDILQNVIEKLDIFEKLKGESEESLDYLIDITQEYFIKKDLCLSLIESSKIITENKDNKDYRKIPGLIENSLKISLRDKNIGRVYGNKEDAKIQYRYYTEKKIRFGTHLENFNKLIGGGFIKKTLNVFLGEPGIGKSRFLTDLSLHYVKLGLNVLYISLELSENSIYQRIDANLLNYNINTFETITESDYFDKVEKTRLEMNGLLIIKDYPAESIDIYNIENLIEDIRITKNINIDILVVDYLTVLKTAKNIGMYVGNLYVNGKMISNELLSIAKKYELILLTAVHLNRIVWGNLEAKMNNVAESAGIIQAADFAAGLLATESMRKKKRMLISIMKNRLYSVSEGNKALIGFDDSRMRHYQIENEDLDENNKEDIDLEEFDFEKK